ncbi:MAG TPA: trypsin-like peptidase domain-containing protein [Blastocatellia bacterium]|jgi:hypothetical protein
MSDAQPTAPMGISLSQTQLDDLAGLLARRMPPGNIAWLATAALGPEALQQAGNDVGDINAFARSIVQTLHDAGRISNAVMLLYEHGHRNSWLTVGLNHILAGNRLGDEAAMQAFVNEYEPFLSSATIKDQLPKVLRTVCAVALGAPTNKIVGSGFLIAPDLVMTNYHVVEPFLAVDPQTKEIKQNGPGNQIFFFFDYLSAPQPRVPPGDVSHTSLVVTAAEKWLEYARELLPGDGAAKPPLKVNKEFDYAVIRLARRVGDRPARRGGGAKRGYLNLPKGKIDVLSMNRRILVFQHPQAAPQQFDIGDFVQMDPSGTRVWYSVSSAHGSSGGAAVDSEGQLFALHNAEVQAAVAVANGKRVNQGVRIDTIAEDLAAEMPELLTALPQTDGDHLFWSLNDDVQNSRPIIGRKKFRETVIEMAGPNADRVLVITGPPGSGLQFSIKLLRHTLGTQVPVAEFSPAELSTLEPRLFLRHLVNKLGVIGVSGDSIPELPATANVSGWLRQDLPKWLFEQLSKDEQQDRFKYPAWVVINTVTPPLQPPMLWADNLQELVAALAGARSPNHTEIPLPQLRWLFLAYPSVILPISGVKKLEEDLDNYNSYEGDFAECMQLAYYSVDKEVVLPDLLLRNLAQYVKQRNVGSPLRKELADAVRQLIYNGP